MSLCRARRRRLAAGLVGLARSRRGVAAVEFALAAPVVVLLLFGSIELGRALWSHSTLQYAAEQAARYASVTEGAADEDIVQAARASAAGLGGSVGVAVVREATAPAFVSVRLSFGFSPLFNQFPAIALEGRSRAPVLY